MNGFLGKVLAANPGAHGAGKQSVSDAICKVDFAGKRLGAHLLLRNNRGKMARDYYRLR